MRNLGILDALDNLNTLVEVDALNEIEVTDDAHLIPHKGEGENEGIEAYWVPAGVDDQTIDAIKTTFQSVHDHLKTSYQKMKGSGDSKHLVAGMNTIMVLVGEAAKKLERFGAVFKDKVTDSKEYKDLQNFYRNRVIKESFREFAKTPISKERINTQPEEWEEELEELLAHEEHVEEVEGVHLLNDVEVVKRDHLYELFYLKNEAGHNFYTYDLARNLKLGCDFGEFAEEFFGEDPLLQIKNWEDKGLHLLAQKIVSKNRNAIERFYKQAMKYREMEMVEKVHHALMALMLASNPRNLIRQFAFKGCHRYFSDFLYYLRQTIENREYQKFLIYSPPTGKTFFVELIHLVEDLCHSLFTLGADLSEMEKALKNLVDRMGYPKDKSLSETLAYANQAITQTLKKHPSGPIFKAVDIIREEEDQFFDPIGQGNIPNEVCRLIGEGMEVKVLRIPCPIMQEFVNKAYITEEFKTFLRNFPEHEHLLYINFQDRTSWKEYARCVALEECGRQAEFSKALTVVTLPLESDFYNQTGAYHEVSKSDQFIESFMNHLEDEATGYVFPTYLKKELFPEFMEALLTNVHTVFFDSKAALSYIERLDFIQIAYQLIILKLIEKVKPTYLNLGSKDSLDANGVAATSLIAFLSVGRKKNLSEEETDRLMGILFGPTLMQRERVIHREYFDRMDAFIRHLEEKGNYLTTLSRLFKNGKYPDISL